MTEDVLDRALSAKCEDDCVPAFVVTLEEFIVVGFDFFGGALVEALVRALVVANLHLETLYPLSGIDHTRCQEGALWQRRDFVTGKSSWRWSYCRWRRHAWAMLLPQVYRDLVEAVDCLWWRLFLKLLSRGGVFSNLPEAVLLQVEEACLVMLLPQAVVTWWRRLICLW